LMINRELMNLFDRLKKALERGSRAWVLLFFNFLLFLYF